jgi:XTP/dITP diphosphohydrolase
MFKFITSNKGKINTARIKLAPYKIEFEPFDIQLTEPQADHVMDVAKAKAEQAFEIVKEPIVVTDHGWEIPALNGFPGPYMKYINQWLNGQDLLNLMQDKDDKTINKIVALVYKDQTQTKNFIATTSGKFLENVRGNGLPAMTVVSFSNTGKSVAEMWEEGDDPFPESTIWDTFAKWKKKVS